MDKGNASRDGINLNEALDLYFESLTLPPLLAGDRKKRILQDLENRAESRVDISLSDYYLTVYREGANWYIDRGSLDKAIENTRQRNSL